MSSEPVRKRRGPVQPGAGRGADVVPLRRRDESASACPIAKCDGTGWIDSDDGAVAPCECRSIVRTRSRARGLASTIPARFRGVSLERPPLSDMARQPETRAVVAHVADYVENMDQRLADGAGLWLSGDVGTGKTTL